MLSTLFQSMAWQPSAAPAHRSHPPTATRRVPTAVAAELQVVMQRFMPMIPCIDTDAASLGVASVDGGALASPVWLMRSLTDPSDSFDVRKKAAENGYVAFADRGRPLRCDGDGDDGAAPSREAGVLDECFVGTLQAAQYGGAELDALAVELGGERPLLVVSLGKTESTKVSQLLVATDAGVRSGVLSGVLSGVAAQ